MEEKETLQLAEKMRIHKADDNKFRTNIYSKVFNTVMGLRVTQV
jgi:hypothetical protein